MCENQKYYLYYYTVNDGLSNLKLQGKYFSFTFWICVKKGLHCAVKLFF